MDDRPDRKTWPSLDSPLVCFSLSSLFSLSFSLAQEFRESSYQASAASKQKLLSRGTERGRDWDWDFRENLIFRGGRNNTAQCRKSYTNELKMTHPGHRRSQKRASIENYFSVRYTFSFLLQNEPIFFS